MRLYLLLNKLTGLIVIWAAACTFVTCAGPRTTARHELLFIDSQDQDTSCYLHILPAEQPFSIELQGNCRRTCDSSYLYRLTIGTYEHPGFSVESYKVSPDDVVLSINGVKPHSRYDLLNCPYENRPFIALSYHMFWFRRNELTRSEGDSTTLQLSLRFNDYLRYEGQMIPLPDAILLDPWFDTLQPEPLSQER